MRIKRVQLSVQNAQLEKFLWAMQLRVPAAAMTARHSHGQMVWKGKRHVQNAHWVKFIHLMENVTLAPAANSALQPGNRSKSATIVLRGGFALVAALCYPNRDGGCQVVDRAKDI